MISELISNKLIDVLGISLKGLCKEQAIAVAGIKRGELCWENVLKSIQIGANCPDVRVIITYVFYNGAGSSELEKFANIIATYPNIYLKVNNLLHKKHHQDNLSAIETENLLKTANNFLKKHSEWKNRIIVVNTHEVLDCGIADLMEYVPSEKKKTGKNLILEEHGNRKSKNSQN